MISRATECSKPGLETGDQANCGVVGCLLAAFVCIGINHVGTAETETLQPAWRTIRQ